MARQTKYHTDSKGKILRYKGGTPVRNDDFEEGPTDTAYREAARLGLKKRVEAMLRAGVPVPDELLKRAKIKKKN
jgi:hypothetical protein